MQNDNEVKVTDRDYMNFYSQLAPFGSLDVYTAIDTAKDCGKDADWAGEQISNYADEVGCKIEDIDPVACVYDSILQEARGEIEQLTKYDFCNDFKGRTSIYCAGNYTATSYDYSEDAIKELTSKLKKKKVKPADLSELSQWFLKEIGVNF